MVTHRPSDELLERLAERLKAMADPMRLRLLHELEGREVCVGDLAQRVGGSPANVSKHLAVLRAAGVVRCRREGMNVCYTIDDASVFDVCRQVCESLSRQADRTAEEIRRGATWLPAGSAEPEPDDNARGAMR